MHPFQMMIRGASYHACILALLCLSLVDMQPLTHVCVSARVRACSYEECEGSMDKIPSERIRKKKPRSYAHAKVQKGVGQHPSCPSRAQMAVHIQGTQCYAGPKAQGHRYIHEYTFLEPCSGVLLLQVFMRFSSGTDMRWIKFCLKKHLIELSDITFIYLCQHFR